MTGHLTLRRSAVLKIIVNEYIENAAPVASENIIHKYSLGVSSATIRNDMAYLEEECYITRPHTSSGCIPMDKAYRYYVESLSKDIRLSADLQRRIRESFKDVEEEIESWLKLAADIVARVVGNAAMVSFPKASESKFKHIELVSLNEVLAMMVLILNEALIRQHLVTFNKPVTQEQLTSIANKLNSSYSGRTIPEMATNKLEPASQERQVMDTITDIMTSEDETGYNELYFDGLRLMLSQPDFVQKSRMLDIMQLMEAREWLKPMLQRKRDSQNVEVIIGEESHDAMLKDLSVVLRGYGIPRTAGGTIGVIGPTRMNYPRVISTVDYVSEILSDLIGGVCR